MKDSSKQSQTIEIVGFLDNYAETGSEGAYYIVQDKNHIDEKGMYSWDGTHILDRNGYKDYLKFFFPDADITKDKPIWEGEPVFIRSSFVHYHSINRRKKSINLLDYLKSIYYRKFYEGSPYGQLTLGGHYVHGIPINIDLGFWYTACFTQGGKWPAILTRTQL